MYCQKLLRVECCWIKFHYHPEKHTDMKMKDENGEDMDQEEGAEPLSQNETES
jgi:hypothetical protein